MPSQPGTPGQIGSPAPPQAMHEPPAVTRESTVGGSSTTPLPPSLEPGLQELSIAAKPSPHIPPPNIPETLTPAPVTVVRSPAQATHPSFPSATHPTSLPGGGVGMQGQQNLAAGAGGMAQAQVPFGSSPIAYSQVLGAAPPTLGGLPLSPPTISLPFVAPTISLGTPPKLIS